MALLVLSVFGDLDVYDSTEAAELHIEPYDAADTEFAVDDLGGDTMSASFHARRRIEKAGCSEFPSRALDLFLRTWMQCA